MTIQPVSHMIYRTANGLSVRAACLHGLGATDSRLAAREFLISVAKEDPDPQLRCVALRSIANENQPWSRSSWSMVSTYNLLKTNSVSGWMPIEKRVSTR